MDDCSIPLIIRYIIARQLFSLVHVQINATFEKTPTALLKPVQAQAQMSSSYNYKFAPESKVDV